MDSKKVLNLITNIYLFFIVIIYPLIIDSSGYEQILECKYQSFLSINIIYFIVTIIICLYYLILKKDNYFKKIKIKKKTIIFISIFILINILSALFSPYKEYDLLVGLGRGEGLLNVIQYTLVFIFIIIFGKFEKKHFFYFTISCLIVSFIAILQYADIKILNLYRGQNGPYNMSYITTIGNIDFVSTYYVLTLSVIFCNFVFLKNNKIINIVNIISFLLGVFVFLLINVNSGKVAFIITLLILIPFILKNNKYLSKAFFLFSLVIFSYFINYFINPVFRIKLWTYKPEWNFDLISILLFLIFLLFLFVSYYAYKNNYEVKNHKKIIKNICFSYLILGLISLLLIYFIPFNFSILGELHQILHGNFDDKLGTYRLFLWKRTLPLIKDYPILGSGPDTFSIRFMSNYLMDVIKLDKKITINDTAANVYLTMIINIGILGLLSYLIFIINEIKNSLQKINKYPFILLIAFIGFLVQDFFNLSVVIVTPLFWTLLGLLYLSNNTLTENNNNDSIILE